MRADGRVSRKCPENIRRFVTFAASRPQFRVGLLRFRVTLNDMCTHALPTVYKTEHKVNQTEAPCLLRRSPLERDRSEIADTRRTRLLKPTFFYTSNVGVRAEAITLWPRVAILSADNKFFNHFLRLSSRLVLYTRYSSRDENHVRQFNR